MTSDTKQPKKPLIPQPDAVKRLREKYLERKSKLKPSAEMDEIMEKYRQSLEEKSKKAPDAEKKRIPKVARRRTPDVDLS